MLGSGNDYFTFETTHEGTTTLILGNGNDIVRVKEILGNTSILGGAGNDTVNVWDDAETLLGMKADLSFNGDLHKKETAVPVSANEITESELVFIDSDSGLVMANVAVLDEETGEIVEVDVPVEILVDRVDENGDPVIDPESGNPYQDPVTIIKKEIVTREVPLNYAEKEMIDEYYAGSDTLNVNNVGNGNNTIGLLTGSLLKGLEMADNQGEATKIQYSALDIMNIFLGEAEDTFNIQGTTAVTNLNTGGGNDTINVSSDAPVNTGSLDNILGAVNIDAEAGSHNIFNVSDAGDPDADANVVITRSSITGLAPAAITYKATDGSFESTFDPDTGSFSGGINIMAGTGGNTIAVINTRNEVGLVEVTTAKAGTGNDQVLITDTQIDPHRYLIVQGQSGEDTLNAAATSQGVTVFGGENNDVITGGTGNDVLVGDLGIDSILGNSGNDIIVGDNAFIIRDASYAVQRIETGNEEEGADDIIDGGTDNDVILGGAGNDQLTASVGANIILGDNGVVVRKDGSPQEDDVFSGSPGIGGNDLITGGQGNNILIGGAGADQITGGAGNDVILGDSGYVTRDGSEMVTKAATISDNVGGNDTIDGGAGNDVILGGAANDIITALYGNNIILGDAGEANINNDDSNDVFTTTPESGGADTITGGGNGSNIIIGGAFGDIITGGIGQDVILGDGGDVTRNGNMLVTRVYTIDDTTGGIDIIDGYAGNDVIIGGAAGDIISALLGNNIILGDAGEANMNNIGSNDVFTTTPAVGGVDKITGGGDGSNIIIGGAFGDIITGGIGQDIILGDGGHVYRNGDMLVTRVRTRDDAIGGKDNIDGGAGNDVILGGAEGDTITALLDDNIILGDAGEANMNNTESNNIFTTTPAVGGVDEITGGGNGSNIILGGAEGDVITGGSGNDIILGDNGRVFRDTAGVVTVVTQVVTLRTD